GTESIEGMVVPCELESYICNRSRAFRKLSSLRLLIVKGDEIGCYGPISDPIDYLPNSLQWLDWSYYPFESLPANFQPRKLVGLYMFSSCIVELWEGFKVFDRLTTINLSWSKNLRRTPDFSGVPNLQRIILKQCVSLEEVHSSIVYLRKLILLNMENCKNLEFFPSSIQMESLESFNISGCLKLQNFPEIEGNMDSLSELRLAHTAILELTSSVGCLSAISLLDLSLCKELFGLPTNVCQLMKLKILILKGCSRLTTLPENLGNLEQLEELYADDTDIWQLPDSINFLNKLIVLSLRKGWNVKCHSSVNLKLSNRNDLWKLKKLDLSGCNLLDEDIYDLRLLSSLSELNLSRNKFVYLADIHHLSQLRYLNITYCENLRMLHSLPRSLWELHADDFLAKDCTFFLPSCKELHLISFTNSSYEQLYSDKGSDSSLMVDNGQRENMISTTVQNLTDSIRRIEMIFLSERVPSAIIYPERAIPKWFDYSSKEEKISVNLPKDWYNENFLGFVVCCSTYMGDGVYGPADSSISGNYDNTFIKTKLICRDHWQELKVVEKRCKMSTASSTFCCYLCIAFIPFYSLWQASDDTLDITNPNQYWLFEASLDLSISNDWAVRLVYCKREDVVDIPEGLDIVQFLTCIENGWPVDLRRLLASSGKILPRYERGKYK
ncbi:hypothetical protein HAX54_015317, partial [Datura stramonium]|nr:hypothetical protein [Datura stramonium]